MNITNNNLLELGFNENIVTPEEAGDENGYKYYCFNVNDKCLLISNSDDECDNEYTIEFYNHNSIEIKDFRFLTQLVSIINWNIKRNSL